MDSNDAIENCKKKKYIYIWMDEKYREVELEKSKSGITESMPSGFLAELIGEFWWQW